MVYCIAGKNGVFAKDDIQATYNVTLDLYIYPVTSMLILFHQGTLFFHLRNVRSKNAHSHRISGNKTHTPGQQPSRIDKEIIHPNDELGATPATSSYKQPQKPLIPIVQASETYGKLDSTFTDSAAQTPMVGDLHTNYIDDNGEMHKKNGIEFVTGYDCFVHCPSFDKHSDEGGIYNDDHRAIFTGLVKTDDASNGSNVSNHDAEEDHRTLHNMLVQVPKDTWPKRHMDLEPVALHGLDTHDVVSDKGSHFVQTPFTMPFKKDTIIHTYPGSLTGVQPEKDHHVMFEQEKRVMPESYDNEENTSTLPSSAGLSKSDSGYTSIVEEPDYVRHKSPIELEKVSLSGIQPNSNNDGSADAAFNATQSKFPLVDLEEWMLSNYEMKPQAGLQEHILKNWLKTESLTGVDTASCYQDASESMPDEYDQDKGNHDSQLMHGLLPYDEPSACKNWLDIDVLPGVKSNTQLHDDAVPELDQHEDREYWRQAFPLVGVSNNNEDIPVKNWLNLGNLHGVQQETTAVYESDAQHGVFGESFESLESDMQHELEMLSGIRMDVNDMPPTKNWLDVEMLTGIDPISSKSAGDSIPSDDVQPMSKEDTQTLKKPLPRNIDDTFFSSKPRKDRLRSSTLPGSQILHELYGAPNAFTHVHSIEATQNKKGDMTPKESKHQRQRAVTMDATSDLPELTDPGKPPCEEKSKALPPLPASTAHSSDDDEQSIASFGSIQPPAMPVLPKKQSPHHNNMIIEREHWPIMTDVADCKE